MKYIKEINLLVVIYAVFDIFVLERYFSDLEESYFDLPPPSIFENEYILAIGYIVHLLLLINLALWIAKDYKQIMAVAGDQVIYFLILTIIAFLAFQTIVDVKFLIPDNLEKIIHLEEIVHLSLFWVLYLIGANSYKVYFTKIQETAN